MAVTGRPRKTVARASTVVTLTTTGTDKPAKERALSTGRLTRAATVPQNEGDAAAVARVHRPMAPVPPRRTSRRFHAREPARQVKIHTLRRLLPPCPHVVMPHGGAQARVLELQYSTDRTAIVPEKNARARGYASKMTQFKELYAPAVK